LGQDLCVGSLEAIAVCGRYALYGPVSRLREHFGASGLDGFDFRPRFNIGPLSFAPVVRTEDGGRVAAMLRWGLLPSWARDAGMAARLINARAESAAEKPSFRAAFKARRCIVPADAFYEWQQRAAGKQPWAIRMKSGEPMGLAGLWEHWTAPGGERLETYTILTTSANDLMAPLHARRPVILPADAYGLWLDGLQPVAALMPLLLPCEAGLLSAHPVSKRVGNVRNDDPDLLEPVDDAG
jgi:putative SOS response-associated peptidase YedK